MRRTVRNKRLAHKCRTLAWQLGGLRRYAEDQGVKVKERERTSSENYARRSFELSGRVLDAEDKLARIPRLVRWIFRAL